MNKRVLILAIPIMAACLNKSLWCAGCTSCSCQIQQHVNPRFADRMQKLHNLRGSRTELKERLLALHKQKHPGTINTSTAAPLEDVLLAEQTMNDQERTHLRRLSQMLTPLMIAYKEETLLPQNTTNASDVELDYLQTINVFLIKLNASYEKLPQATQEYLKTTNFCQHPLGARFIALMAGLKKYIVLKNNAYKSIKSPDSLTKELKKITAALDKMINSWQELLSSGNKSKTKP